MAFLTIEPPTEAAALQGSGDVHRLLCFETLKTEKRRIAHQCFQSCGRETLRTELKQGHEGLLQSRAVLLTAVGEAPGQIHSGGVLVREHGGQQRGITLNIRRHHEDVPWLKRGIVGHPVKNVIPHQLHFPPGTCTAHEQQGAIGALALQWNMFGACKLPLQLLQQGPLPAFGSCHRHRIGKQISLVRVAEQAVATALQ